MKWLNALATSVAGLALACQPANAEDVLASAVIAARPPLPQPVRKVRPNNLSAIIASPPPGTQPPVIADVSDPYTSIGRGFDPIQGRAMDDSCVESVTGQDEPFGDGSIKDHNRKIVSDENSYASVSSSSVGVSAVIKAVSLGFGTSSASGSVFNSVDQFARVYYRVAVDGSERRNVKWTRRAESLLKSGSSKDMGTFLRECGTRYIRAVYRGHLLDTTVVFQMHEDQTEAASAFNLSVGVKGVFDVAGGSSDAQTTVNRLAYVDLQDHGRGQFSVPQPPAATAAGVGDPGGGGAQLSSSSSTHQSTPAAPTGDGKQPVGGQQPQPSDSSTSANAGAAVPPAMGTSKLETLISWYESGFEQAVLKADKKTAKPLYVTIERYVDKTRLPYLDRIPSWPDEIYAAIEAKADVYNDLVTAISDIDSTTSHDPENKRLSTFYSDDAASAAAKRQNAKNLLSGFQGAMQTCEGYIYAGKEKDATGKYVARLCSDDLDSKLSAAMVDAIRLKRKYK